MGKLYIGVSRKRMLTRKLSNVKSRGVVTQRTRSPNSQKEHLTSAEKGVLIFPGVWWPRFQTGMGEASVGHHQLASSSADDFRDLWNPFLPPWPPFWNMVSLIQLFISRLLCSFPLLEMCWDLSYNYLDSFECIPSFLFYWGLWKEAEDMVVHTLSCSWL